MCVLDSLIQSIPFLSEMMHQRPIELARLPHRGKEKVTHHIYLQHAREAKTQMLHMGLMPRAD